MAAIVIAGCAVYANSLNGPLIWDDQKAIVDNQNIRTLSPPWRALIPPSESPLAARPIVNFSFALNYALDGLDVIGYRLVNVAVHVAAALLLFTIVRRTLSREPLLTRFGVTGAASAAFVAALWWVVHPLASEPVDYVTQRTESLMALCLLLTIYAAIRALDAPRQRLWTTVAFFSCAAGMASKESMIVAPLLIVFYDRIFVFSSLRQAVQSRKTLYVALAVTWVELAFLMMWQTHSTVGPRAGVGSWRYLMNQADLIVRYIRLALWPDALVLDYGLPRALSLRDVLPQAAIVAALVAATIIALWRWPGLAFLGLVFFLALAPTSSILAISTEVGSERRMYLPLAALSVLMVVTGWTAFERAAAATVLDQRRKVAAVFIALAAVWIGALAVRTIDRNAEYQSELSIWQSSLERYPHGRARMSYANALTAAGQAERAIGELRQAVHDYPTAHYALGTELAAQGHADEAIRELAAFIDLQPGNADRIPARTLKGRLLASVGRLDEARSDFEVLLNLWPTLLDARASLADVLVMQRRYDEAASHYRAFLERRPADAQMLVKLGLALAAEGKLPEAIETYQRAVESDPRLLTARLNLSEAYLRTDRAQDAAIQAAEALRLDPGRADAHNLLGAALSASGNLSEGVGHFRKALELDPANAAARRNLERAQLILGAQR